MTLPDERLFGKPRVHRAVKLWVDPWSVSMSLQPAMAEAVKNVRSLNENAQYRGHYALAEVFQDRWSHIRDRRAEPVQVMGSVSRHGIKFHHFKSMPVLMWDEDFPGNRGAPFRHNVILDAVGRTMVDQAIQEGRRRLAALLQNMNPLELADLMHNQPPP